MDERDEDLEEFDPNIPEEGPTAPPPGWLDCVTGYQEPKGDDGADQLYPPPPAYNTLTDDTRNTSVPIVRVPTVSEDEAREALLQYVDSNCCYSNKPARNLVFKSLRPLTVYRYRLETYTETRSSAWEFHAYNGEQHVDGPQYGVSPPPWDIPVLTPEKYTERVDKICVPHSCVVKLCHRCRGCGKVRCSNCHGRGQKRCSMCHGSGHSRNKRCISCHGRGKKRCAPCLGRGHRTCSACHGHRNLLHFIQLTVTWKNHVFEFIPDRFPEFPLKKFGRVTADPFFVDENLLVYPIDGFPDDDICEQSQIAIQQHFRKLSSVSRILQQRQTIELVPLTHAFYAYNGKDYEYFIYGLEKKVYSPKYPSACSIL